MDNAAIQVVLSSKNAPVKFKWRNTIHRIEEVLECWRLTGAWWDGEGEQTFFRIRTDKGSIYELSFDHARSAWAMAVIQD